MTPVPCFVFPWKKKRASRSKSTIMPNFTNSDLGFTSSASLPITPRDVIYTTKPPCYYERTCKIQQSSRLDDDEEGNEDLPPYECTVYKMGFMMIKTELEEPTKKLRRRSWRKLYIVLWGTTIRAYKSIPTTENEEKKPIWCYSMQDAEAGQATDYNKRRHVIRLRIQQGPQFLIRTKGEEDQLLWIEHLQASVNVSLDLDTRKMPQFITSSRRRRRVRVHQDRNIPSRHHQREGALI